MLKTWSIIRLRVVSRKWRKYTFEDLSHIIYFQFEALRCQSTRTNFGIEWFLELSAWLENEPGANFSLRGHKRFTQCQLNNTLSITHLLAFSFCFRWPVEGEHRFFRKCRSFESPLAIFISLCSSAHKFYSTTCEHLSKDIPALTISTILKTIVTDTVKIWYCDSAISKKDQWNL